MAYPSIQAMKDALGTIILLTAWDPGSKTYVNYTFDMLPSAAQVAMFQWLNQFE